MHKMVAVCPLAISTADVSQALEARERAEVIKLFDVLLPKIDVKKGDGLGSDMDCVFDQKWDPSFRRDAGGEPTEQFYPRELISLQEALDPSGRHTNMFCSYAERDAAAQKRAEDSNRDVAVASVGFSYPEFGPGLQTATVYYQRWSKIFLPNRRKDLPVGSYGAIEFSLHDGIWAFKMVPTGTMN